MDPFTCSILSPTVLRKTKMAYSFGLSECNKVNEVFNRTQVVVSKEDVLFCKLLDMLIFTKKSLREYLFIYRYFI